MIVVIAAAPDCPTRDYYVDEKNDSKMITSYMIRSPLIDLANEQRSAQARTMIERFPTLRQYYCPFY